jgi:hypothetical protein
MLLLFAMLMLGTTLTFAQVVTLPSVTGKAGTSVSVPISVTGLGSNVKSYQFTLSYDNTKIDITGASNTGTISDVAGSLLQANPDLTNGKLYVAWASPTSITATSGNLINLTVSFKVAGTSALSVGTTFLFNSTQIAVANGSATAATIEVSVGSVTDAQKDVEVLIPINTSALVTTDNVRSFNFTLTYDAAKLQILGNTVANSLGVNGTTAENNTTAGTYLLSWASGATDPVTTAAVGALVYVRAKMLVKGSTDVTLGAFIYNGGTPAVVRANGTITAVNIAPVFGANTTPLTVAENAALAFTLVATDADGDALTYSYTPAVTGATFNTATGAFSWTPSYTDAGTYTLAFGVTDGTVSASPLSVTINVTDVNRAPTLTLNPAGPAFTVAEGAAFTLTLIGADLDTDNTLTYSMVTTPPAIAGAALTAGGVFTWTPTYAQSGSYSIDFKVADYKGTTAVGGSATVTATITVSNVNRAPVFTATIPNGTIADVHIAPNPVFYKFQYTGNDPDGTPVAYSLIAGPTGSSITTDGLFSWAPTVSQAGSSFVVTVQISDGTLTALSTVIIFASSTITSVNEYSGIPTEYVLMQNYPNPFNPTTSIRFGLPTESNVRLSVFNILGQEVALLVNQTMSAGYHKVDFDASQLTSGLYFYKVQAENFVQVKKMLLMK